MAIVTIRLGSSEERDVHGNLIGETWVEYDVDDVLLRMTALRYINTTSRPGNVKLWQQSDPTRVIERTIPPGTPLTTIAVPTGQSNRIAITRDANGRIGGIEGGWEWPSG